MSNLVGKTLLNRYNVQEFLGRGGMAEVYKVWASQRMTYLALKVLLEDFALDRVFIRRFTREANTLAKLQHPNIVRFFGFEKEDYLAFMLMDYIDGKSLKHLIHDAAGKAMPYGHIRVITRSVCGALHYAHSQGLVHCDIKPANIMIDLKGTVQLADFGIARMSDTATATMVGAGTPAYMAPEQIKGLGPVPQMDIYALGVVLYEMFTGGERPFTGDHAQTTGGTSERVRWEQLHLSPPGPKQWNPSLSDEIEAVILKCLEKKPEDRYESALILVNALELALEDIQDNDIAAFASIAVGIEKQNEKAAFSPQPTLDRKIRPWMIGVAVAIFAGFFALINSTTRKSPSGEGKYTEYAVYSEETQNTSEAFEAEDVPPIITLTFTPVSTATPNIPYSGDTQENPVDKARIVFIPEGEFQMGYTDKHIDVLLNICSTCSYGNFSDAPLHSVYLDAYWIYKYEVTNDEYQQCVDAGACTLPVKVYSSSRKDYYENSRYANYPVIFVDWQRAYDYCRWADGSLPSEAQWEKAARGTDDLRIFPWGNSSPNTQTANIKGGIGDTAEVGSFSAGASPYGVMDMAGNVYEWVYDWYSESYYSESPYKNPWGPSAAQTSPPKRVVRGGNISWGPVFASSSFHDWWEPEKSSWDVGFRCVIPYTP